MFKFIKYSSRSQATQSQKQMHYSQHCYVAVGDTYPIEVFLTKSAALDFIEDWNRRNPQRPIRYYRCPLNQLSQPKSENEEITPANVWVYS